MDRGGFPDWNRIILEQLARLGLNSAKVLLLSVMRTLELLSDVERPFHADVSDGSRFELCLKSIEQLSQTTFSTGSGYFMVFLTRKASRESHVQLSRRPR